MQYRNFFRRKSAAGPKQISAALFEEITIRGRFIYGYLCLAGLIKEKNFDKLPLELDYVLHEFVSSDNLGIWQGKADDLMPSYILEEGQDRTSTFFKDPEIDRVRVFYQDQPAYLIEMIEDLMWIGISNLYVGYDSAESLQYLERIIQRMRDQSVLLPEFKIVENCTVTQKDKWGKQDDLTKYHTLQGTV